MGHEKWVQRKFDFLHRQFLNFGFHLDGVSRPKIVSLRAEVQKKSSGASDFSEQVWRFSLHMLSTVMHSSIIDIQSRKGAELNLQWYVESANATRDSPSPSKSDSVWYPCVFLAVYGYRWACDPFQLDVASTDDAAKNIDRCWKLLAASICSLIVLKIVRQQKRCSSLVWSVYQLSNIMKSSSNFSFNNFRLNFSFHLVAVNVATRKEGRR